MFRTNVDKLVKISVFGEIASPVVGRSIYNVSAEGFPMVLPGVSWITYSARGAKVAEETKEAAKKVKEKID